MDLQTLNVQIRELYSMFEEGGFDVSNRIIYRQDTLPLPYAKLIYRYQNPLIVIPSSITREPLLEHRILATLASAILSGVALYEHLLSTGNEQSVSTDLTEYLLDERNTNPAPLPPLPLEWKLLTLTTFYASKGYPFLKAFEGSERVVA